MNDLSPVLASLNEHLGHCRALLTLNEVQVSPSKTARDSRADDINTLVPIIEAFGLIAADIQALTAKVNEIVTFLKANKTLTHGTLPQVL